MKTTTPRILVVEDEAELRDAMKWNLDNDGYEVLTAGDGREALRLARLERPDLILLDLMLPEMSGKKVCKKLTADPATQEIPIVIVTARDSEIDRIVGFELGATDYVVKPFSMRELLLRVRAIVRRRSAPGDPAAASRSVLRAGEVELDPVGWRVSVADKPVPLTALEFNLLEAFFRNRGRVLSREMLLDMCWPEDAAPLDRTVDAMVMRLRHKLGAAGQVIETVRGVGYRCR